MEFATKDMDKAKKALAETAEKLAAAKGDLEVASKDLAEDIKKKKYSSRKLHDSCRGI
jgi:hypothetical protein